LATDEQSFAERSNRRTPEFSRAELRRMKAQALLSFSPAQTMIADLCFVFQK
jgi:hypothetical protein